MTDNAHEAAQDLATRVRRGRPPKDRSEASGPEREPQGRAERVPLGSKQPKLKASNRPGFVRRWINDDKGRIQQALQGGYEFVRKDGEARKTDNMAEVISQVVGAKDGGGPLTAYLMEIRAEWYAEDQATKGKELDAIEDQLRRGSVQGGATVGQDGFYSRGIKIKRERIG